MAMDLPPEPRIGDRERDAAATRLQQAVGDGRLTLDEFEERMDLVLAARTRVDLEPLLADLPVTDPADQPVLATSSPLRERLGKARRWMVAVMGGDEAKGRWRPAEHMGAVAVMGGVDIDLRHAVFEHPVITITAVAVMGGIEIVVPPGVEVEMTGFAIMGGRSNLAADPDGHGPLVRLRAFALMGGVDAKTKKLKPELPPPTWPGARELPPS